MGDDIDGLIDQLLDDPANLRDPGAALATVDHPSCRWASVNAALRDPARLPPRLPDDQPMGDMFSRWMIYARGEKHTQLRRRFSGYFGPRQAESFRGVVEGRLSSVLDKVEPVGRMDVVTDLAQQITFPLICDTIGVPWQDRDKLAEQAEVLQNAFPRQSEPPWVARGEAAAARAMDIFESYLAERRAEPRDDFLTELVRRPLGDHEEWRDVAANCLFLLDNAFGNTPTLVASTVGLLLDHPEAAAAIRRRDVTLDAVTEEAARLVTPVTYGLSADANDEGWVTHYLAAANRDPDQFPDPDRFDPSRNPNRHLAFFVGPHACLGATLAKLIAGVVVDHTLLRLPGLRRAGRASWASTNPLHRLAHMPVAWDT